MLDDTFHIAAHHLPLGFSAAHFQLQASGTYLADFHPRAFALIDLETYHSAYMGKRHLKEELFFFCERNRFYPVWSFQKKEKDDAQCASSFRFLLLCFYW